MQKPSDELYDANGAREQNQKQQLRQLPDTLQHLERKKADFLRKTGTGSNHNRS